MPQHLETIFAIVGFIQAQISILLCWGLVSCINEVCSNKKKKPFSRSNLFILCFWTFYFWVSFSWVQRKWTNFRLAISRLQTVSWHMGEEHLHIKWENYKTWNLNTYTKENGKSYLQTSKELIELSSLQQRVNDHELYRKEKVLVHGRISKITVASLQLFTKLWIVFFR